MGNKRTPGKWEINPDDPHEILDENGDVVCWTDNEPAENEALMAMSRERAALIVREHNAHDELVAACEKMCIELAHLGKHDPHLENNLVLPALLAEAEAAIIKATEATHD